MFIRCYKSNSKINPPWHSLISSLLLLQMISAVTKLPDLNREGKLLILFRLTILYFFNPWWRDSNGLLLTTEYDIPFILGSWKVYLKLCWQSLHTIFMFDICIFVTISITYHNIQLEYPAKTDILYDLKKYNLEFEMWRKKCNSEEASLLEMPNHIFKFL